MKLGIARVEQEWKIFYIHYSVNQNLLTAI